MFGAYSLVTDSIIIAKVSFITNQITFTKYLQYTGFSYHGVIYESDKFFLVSRTSSYLYITTSSSFNVGP